MNDAPTDLPRPPAHPRRLVFFGTPAAAVPPLEAVIAAGFEIALVVTGPDRRRGRGGARTPTPVGFCAMEHGLPISHDPAAAADVGADLGVVVAYGQILRRPLLEQLPMINLHFSLLPRWRGAAPVERAILAGDDRTGVCVMDIDEGLDTGAVHARAELAIRRSSTADVLSAQLSELGAQLLVDTLRRGLGEPEPQAGEVTYASKISTTELEIDWDRPAAEVDRLVRIGGAWTTFRGRRLKILSGRPLVHPEAPMAGEPGEIIEDVVRCGEGGLQLREVQPEGRPRTGFGDWANGARPLAGETMGERS